MGLVPKPSLLLLRKSKKKSAALADVKGNLMTVMPESGIMGDELAISSKNPEGMASIDRGSARMYLVPKNLFDRLPLKYGSSMKKSWEGNKSRDGYSLFDKLKRENKDSTGEYKMEQWVPMRGIPHSTSFSDLCRAGKLSVKFNRSYAACAPKLSRRNQGETKPTVGWYGKQVNMCPRDTSIVPGILCIGVEDVMCCGTDFCGDREPSDPSLRQREISFEMPSEVHTIPPGGTEQYSDTAMIGNQLGLTLLSKLDLPWEKQPSRSAVLSSPDPTDIQNEDNPSLITNKSDQHSPVSVLEQLFEDSSPRFEIATTKHSNIKQSIQPLRINFEERRAPAKRLKFHSDTISRPSHPSNKNSFSRTDYIRKVLEASGLDLYQLALNWHSSSQKLDPSIYTKIEDSHSQSQKVPPFETQMLFDFINEVLLDIYQPYCGFYPWVPLSRPKKLHLVTERSIVDEVIKIVAMNLALIDQQVPVQNLAVHAMEKCGTWIDIRRDLEDMVLEIVEEVEEELVDEFVFEMWID